MASIKVIVFHTWIAFPFANWFGVPTLGFVQIPLLGLFECLHRPQHAQLVLLEQKCRDENSDGIQGKTFPTR